MFDFCEWVFELQIVVECDIWYNMPDSDSSFLESLSDHRTLDEDQQMLADIEQNIANLEKSFKSKHDRWSPNFKDKESQPLLKRENSFSSPEATPKDKKRQVSFQ